MHLDKDALREATATAKVVVEHKANRLVLRKIRRIHKSVGVPIGFGANAKLSRHYLELVPRRIIYG